MDGVYSPIGSITSATGSTTVNVDASAMDIRLVLTGGYVSPRSSLVDTWCDFGIGYSSYSDGSPAEMHFVIRASGQINIYAIDWDD